MRGRSALAWTILLDLRQTGSSLFWIDEGTDSGAIAAQASFDLSGDEYLSDLMSMQMNNLRTMLGRLMVDLKSGNRPATPQIDENATYLAVRRPEDGRIDWGQDADAVLRIVRAVSRPYPGAFGFLGENTFRIWRARIVDMRNWFALPGQIFTTIDGCPVIRCGGQTSILIEDFQIESQDGSLQTVPKLGNQRRLF